MANDDSLPKNIIGEGEKFLNSLSPEDRITVSKLQNLGEFLQFAQERPDIEAPYSLWEEIQEFVGSQELPASSPEPEPEEDQAKQPGRRSSHRRTQHFHPAHEEPEEEAEKVEEKNVKPAAKPLPITPPIPPEEKVGQEPQPRTRLEQMERAGQAISVGNLGNQDWGISEPVGQMAIIEQPKRPDQAEEVFVPVQGPGQETVITEQRPSPAPSQTRAGGYPNRRQGGFINRTNRLAARAGRARTPRPSLRKKAVRSVEKKIAFSALPLLAAVFVPLFVGIIVYVSIVGAICTVPGLNYIAKALGMPCSQTTQAITPEPTPTPGPGGGDDGLGPGEFEIPLRCDLKYRSDTYGPIPGHPDGHSAYSIDINRGNGDDDRGDPVLASADGIVVDIVRDHGEVTVKHEGNYYTSYVHMQNIPVSEGQRVNLGQQIGEIGDVGAPPGQYHLHVNHSKNGWYESDRIQVCYKYLDYGCNPASVRVNDRYRTGTNYYKGCQRN